jgi:chromosome partitioning protein
VRALLVASQKGGVGKTTTAVNLAALAGRSGGRVLLVDADPLGSVSASLLLSRDGGDAGAPARPDPVTGAGALWADVLPGVDVVTPYPAADTAERHLQAFLDGLPRSALARTHRLAVVDAPPMLGPRPRALLRAASEVVLVQRAEPMSLRTMPAYLDLVQQVRAEGGAVRLRGVLLTLPEGVPAGTPGEARMRAKFPGLLPQVIPFDPEVARALVLGRPLVVVRPTSPAAAEYASLAEALDLVTAPVPAAPVLVAAGAAARSAPPAAPKTVARATRQRPADPPRPRPGPRPAPAAAEPAAVEDDAADPDLPPKGEAHAASPWLAALAAVMGLVVVALAVKLLLAR